MGHGVGLPQLFASLCMLERPDAVNLVLAIYDALQLLVQTGVTLSSNTLACSMYSEGSRPAPPRSPEAQTLRAYLLPFTSMDEAAVGSQADRGAQGWISSEFHFPLLLCQVRVLMCHFFPVSVDLPEPLQYGIAELWDSRRYTDVTFVVEEERVEAHRVILAAQSSYFDRLLFGEMREARAGAEIPLQGAPADGFKLLLKFAYTGKLEIENASLKVRPSIVIGQSTYSTLVLPHTSYYFSNVCAYVRA